MGVSFVNASSEWELPGGRADSYVLVGHRTAAWSRRRFETRGGQLKQRGKMLGGKPPRRGGRLTNAHREPKPLPRNSGQFLLLIALGCIVIGGVIGFAVGMDRQLRGGLLRQRTEAIARTDWVPIQELPAYVPRAFIAVVDPGLETTGRFRGRNEGRTIPRELVRQIHMLDDGLFGSARELAMAPVLQRLAPDQELIELYLNRVALGHGADVAIHGVYHASREYFGKDARDLTLSEAATLAGLLLEPRIQRPADVPGAVGVRRNEVLRALLDEEEITTEEYSAAVGERLGFQPGLVAIPMTRNPPSAMDTSVIRLPPEYRPVPEDTMEQEAQ